MAIFEHDPDVVRWGLHHLLDVCSSGNSGSPQTITGYDKDVSEVLYVREGYCDNDEIIARAYQEDDSVLDGEVGKRLNQMCPVPVSSFLAA